MCMMMMGKRLLLKVLTPTILLVFVGVSSCQKNGNPNEVNKSGNQESSEILSSSNDLFDPQLNYKSYSPKVSDKVISRSKYLNKMYGFWLGQCIANWTGLVTEMDKIGNIGEIQTGAFYTRDDWGKPDQASIWGEGVPSNLSPTIDFVFEDGWSALVGDDPSIDDFGVLQISRYREQNGCIGADWACLSGRIMFTYC